MPYLGSSNKEERPLKPRKRPSGRHTRRSMAFLLVDLAYRSLLRAKRWHFQVSSHSQAFRSFMLLRTRLCMFFLLCRGIVVGRKSITMA